MFGLPEEAGEEQYQSIQLFADNFVELAWSDIGRLSVAQGGPHEKRVAHLLPTGRDTRSGKKLGGASLEPGKTHSKVTF